MLGLGASDAGRWHRRWQLTLGVQGNGAQAGQLCWQAPYPGRAPCSPHLSLHLQPSLRNTADEGLGDVGVALGPLTMVMPQQGAQGAGRDVSGKGEFLLIAWVAGGAENSEV